jgi:hypothetical protein
LPTSIQAGKPLPTVEVPQPEDLPAKDYQLVSERSVEVRQCTIVSTLIPSETC